MPGQCPRRRRVGEHPFDGMGDARDWAPPGWHWEVISEARRLVRNPGPVVDPDLLWWRSRGPKSVRRQPAPEGLYVDMSGRRTSTSVATWRRWAPVHGGPGRFSGISPEI